MILTPKMIVFSLFLFGFAIFFLIISLKKFKEYNIIKNVPTSKIRSIALGLVEIFGKIKSTKILETPISKIDCAYYRYVIKERYKSGKSTKWRTIKDERSSTPFYIEDNTGSIKVLPNKADLYLNLKKAYYFSLNLFKLKDDPLENLKEMEVVNGKVKSKFRIIKSGDKKYLEYFLKPDNKVYALGTASNEEDSSSLILHKGTQEKHFILGEGSENKILKKLKKSFLITFGLSAVFLIIFGFVFLPVIISTVF